VTVIPESLALAVAATTCHPLAALAVPTCVRRTKGGGFAAEEVPAPRTSEKLPVAVSEEAEAGTPVVAIVIG
jgi:hypothetical protein